MKTNFSKMTAVALIVVMMCSVAAGAAWAEGPDHVLTFASAERAALSPAEVYAQNVNSTVSIKTSSTVNFFGYDAVAGVSGSGFIISPDGYILTNCHIVADAEKITVTMYNGDSYEAELIGYDESNDIAVVKIDASGLTPVTFGDSDKVVVGENVVAIGNPLGELTFSLTHGVVSALDRDVTFSGKVRLRLIQTDCAINSGSSGGALFNMYGEVIGITNAKASGSSYGASVDNIAFAIPVNTVVGIVEQIMTKGEISSPYIGITINNVDEKLLAYGIPEGANIVEVKEGSPADEAGLQPNDIIVGANDTDVFESDDLVKYIRSCAVGDEVVLLVYRQGETLEIRVIVGENIKSALPEHEAEADAE